MLRKGSPPPTCNVSCDTCHVFFFLLLFYFSLFVKVVKFLGGGSVINRANPVSSFKHQDAS